MAGFLERYKTAGMRGDRSGLLQYPLIYLMLLIPGSTLVYLYGGELFYVAIAVLFLICAIVNCRYRESYGICFALLLMVNTMLARAISGGVGLEAWLELSGCILITQMAICCNYKLFLDRWVKTVVLFAVISIALWAILCVAPTLVGTILGAKYLINVSGSVGWETYEYGSGLFFYSWIDIHEFRNCGFFTEPGKYQVVLNSALFILLFWKNKLSEKRAIHYKTCIFVIIVALITCQSTTGYISLLLILTFYLLFFKKLKKDTNIKLYILTAIIIMVSALIIEYSVDSTNSILYTQVISKLFNNGTSLDLSGGTGIYRWKMIQVCASSMISSPLGIGYDQLFSLASAYGEGLVAASFVSYGAVYGLVPWLLMLFMLFYPTFKELPVSMAVLFVLLFANTTLAQTHLLYTSLLLIPAYIAIGHGWPFRRTEAYPEEGIWRRH